ncbi:MAG: hypothetical protein IJ375_04000 [Oscillospiraceae bacterium]|nr:hypothetical protein [Oscillospiraceae bacterium]
MTTLFQNVLQASLYGSIAIAAVMLLRLALKRAPKKYICLLWVLASLRLLCPFQIESGFSLQPDLDSIAAVRAEPTQTARPVYTPAVPEDTALPEDVEVVYGDAFAAETEITQLVVTDYAAIAAGVWLTAACGLGLWSIGSYLRLKRRVREAVLLSEGVWECAGIDTAFILGYLRPRVYLPMGLSAESRGFILDHEQAHLRRGDHWVKLLGFIALAVHWFNPLVWAAYVLLCRDIEMACDEVVVRNMDLEARKSYSAALLACGAGHRSIAACPVAFGEVSVKARILGVLNYRKKSFWFSVIAILAAIFVAVCFLTSPVRKDSRDWKAQCRAVLDEIQSRDCYYILEDRTFEGDDSLVSSVCRNHFGSRENWLLIDYYENMDESQQFLAYFGVGSAYYNSVSSGLDFDWQKTPAQDVAVVVPWLYGFDMDTQETDAISRQETDEGYIIRLKVYGPVGQEETAVNGYHVDFYFESDSSFRHAIQYVYGDGISMITTMYAPEASEEQILSTMSKYAGDLAQRESDISLGTAAVEAAVPLGIYLGGETVQTGAPDWGITLRTDSVTPSGLTLLITQSGDLPLQELYYGQYFSLERLEDGDWTAVEPIIENYGFTLTATSLPQNKTTRVDIRWEWLYGQLPPGTYRIGKDISNQVFPRFGVDIKLNDLPEETNYTYYAEFEIPAASNSEANP